MEYVICNVCSVLFWIMPSSVVL